MKLAICGYDDAPLYLEPEMPTDADAALNNAKPSGDQTSTWRAPATAGPRVLRRILSLDDFEAPARRYLPRVIFGYILSGAERNA
jgi:L-lactate dehydrogenase (cytochrome)